MTLNVVGVFCEDIREEKTGQVSLIGILPDNITIPGPALDKPTSRAAIPKLAVYVRIHIGVNDDPGPMSLRILLPDGQEIDLGSIENSLIEKAKNESRGKNLPLAGIISHAVFGGLIVPKSGIITAVLGAGNDRHVCAALNAQLVPQPSSAPTASAPPASQSPNASPRT